MQCQSDGNTILTKDYSGNDCFKYDFTNSSSEPINTCTFNHLLNSYQTKQCTPGYQIIPTSFSYIHLNNNSCPSDNPNWKDQIYHIFSYPLNVCLNANTLGDNIMITSCQSDNSYITNFYSDYNCTGTITTTTTPSPSIYECESDNTISLCNPTNNYNKF